MGGARAHAEPFVDDRLEQLLLVKEQQLLTALIGGGGGATDCIGTELDDFGLDPVRLVIQSDGAPIVRMDFDHGREAMAALDARTH